MYNCCWFALFVVFVVLCCVVFVLLQLVFCAALMLFEALKILLSTGWTQLAALSAALTGAVPVPFVVPVPLALALRLQAIWVCNGGSCVINGQIKWKPSKRERERGRWGEREREAVWCKSAFTVYLRWNKFLDETENNRTFSGSLSQSLAKD